MMRIQWAERAFVRRQAVEDYILYSFGRQAHAHFVREIRHWKQLLMENPYLGQVESTLEGMSKEYRYFVVLNQSKGIYYVEDDCINIVDWWDTRRSIENLKSGLD